MKMKIELGQNWTKFGTELDQKGCILKELGQRWSRIEPELDHTWTGIGPESPKNQNHFQ